ncbi:glutamyl-tRNA amidotransferase [Pseudoramibacter faecis]|uniref:glutamyl-tRNA amidotransferase n=1 Tax=Pseudoramibacter faecis TaxID=3108534 RepID=UPI002E7828FF|nr:glutamyl-tRNA amidotransferase [Pseudoramibacter sp. HA2172]
MKLFQKNRNENPNKSRLSLTEKGKKSWRIYCAAIIAGALFLAAPLPVFAANDPITVVNNLSDFIFGLIRAVGLILLGWGIVQVGLSFQSHDPSQRSNGFLTLAGGIVITFAKEILNLITG